MRFAIVGCGEIAATHARALRRLPRDAIAALACDVDVARARAFAHAHGLSAASFLDVLADPTIDAICVCTPSGLHATIGCAALEADKHVIVEKPMDITVEACDALLEAQRQSGRTLAVISQRRFDDAAQNAKRAIADGRLGQLVHVDCRVPWYRTQDYYDSGEWRGTWDLDGGGCLMNQGLHSVDLMLWLCGEVATVFAQARTAAHTDIEVEDVLCATLVFHSGAIGTLAASTSDFPASPSRLAVHGTAGGLIVEGDSMAAYALKNGERKPNESPRPHAQLVATGGTKAASAVPADRAAVDVEDWIEGHTRQLLDFVTAIRRCGSPLVDGHEGRRAVQLIQAAYRSARSGLPEEVGR